MTENDPDVRTLEAVLPAARSLGALFRGQGWQLLGLATLAPLAAFLARPVLGDERWGGLADRTWFILALAVPVAHQGLVWLGWRLQLGWGTLSRAFGRYDLAVWGALFLPLLIARPVALLGLALSDRGSLDWPGTLAGAAGVMLLVPCLGTLISVGRHFGVARAIGGDHFRVRYRTMPFVRRGAFRFTPNAMYVFAFLGLWAIALLANSRAALVAAGFQHAYVWVHHFATERPDLAMIYGENDPGRPINDRRRPR